MVELVINVYRSNQLTLGETKQLYMKSNHVMLQWLRYVVGVEIFFPHTDILLQYHL